MKTHFLFSLFSSIKSLKDHQLKPADDSELVFAPKTVVAPCFFNIALNDNPELALQLRRQFEDFHSLHPNDEVTLNDGPQDKKVWYKYGERHEVSLSGTYIERLKHVLTIMTAEENKNRIWAIRKKADHAYPFHAINEGLIIAPGKFVFNSAQNYIDLLNEFGIKKVPSKSVLNKSINKIEGQFPWRYTDDAADAYETFRRNQIVRQFRELMNE